MPGKKPTHTGRDATKEATGIKHEISIHAPHTGRDGLDGRVGMYVEEFQSTRPIRGATSSGSAMRRGRSINFNPRAPYGARLGGCALGVYHGCISIHAPHTGRDAAKMQKINRDIISIHAPHTGRDKLSVRRIQLDADISIHAPHTGRDYPASVCSRVHGGFQSTRPIRGATRQDDGARHHRCISIHAPHTGRDDIRRTAMDIMTKFQSTRPIRGATIVGWLPDVVRGHFNPRAPYGARPKGGIQRLWC